MYYARERFTTTRRSQAVDAYEPLPHVDESVFLEPSGGGETMAQTFHANAATRLHSVEWHSGTAPGVAAALMVENGWDKRDMYRSCRARWWTMLPSHGRFEIFFAISILSNLKVHRVQNPFLFLVIYVHTLPAPSDPLGIALQGR